MKNPDSKNQKKSAENDKSKSEKTQKNLIKPIMIICAALIAVVGIIFFIVNSQNKKIEPRELIENSIKNENLILTAHRGLSSQAPENTVAAIELAGENGYTRVEFDIYKTADNLWVLSHDEDIKRMTDGKGKISDFVFYDLLTYSIDNGANIENYPNLTINSLDQAIQACAKYDMDMMIEIKCSADKNDITRLLDKLKKTGMHEKSSIISFDIDLIDSIRAIDEEIPLYYLIEKLTDNMMKYFLSHGDIGVSFCKNKRQNTEEKIKQLQDAGIPLACWTINSTEDLKKYAALGIETIVTDCIVFK